MKDFFGEDLCAAAAQAYMESLLSGESGAKASEAAEIAYKAAWRAGARVEPGSPCATAEASFRSSYDSGKDTVTNAALAFAKSWPGLEEGNPCSVSTKTYMESIIGGKSIDDAGLSAAKAFIGAFADLAKSGNAVVDASCSKAAKSFIRNSNGPDSAASDAAQRCRRRLLLQGGQVLHQELQRTRLRRLRRCPGLSSTPPAPRRPSPSSGTPTDPTPPPP